MKSPKVNGIGEVVTEYGARVMKVIKKGLLGRSLFDFYGDIKAQAFRTKELDSVPTTPSDKKGGIIYTKSADGKLYYKSNEISEVELSSQGTNTTYSVSCVDGDNSDEEKIRLTGSDSSTDDVVLEAGTGLSIARDGDKITFTNTVTDTDTVLTTEQVQDIAGALIATGGTKTNIAVTYDDANNNMDFVVASDLNTTGTAGGLSSTLVVSSGGTGATTFTSGQILRGNGTSALTADNNLKFDGSSFSIISSTSARPQVLISNTNSDAEAPSLAFDRTSTVGADGDDIGVIRFDAEDASGNGPHTYAQILGEIQEADDGSEEGKLTLSVASHDAESQPGLIIASGNSEDEVDVTVGNGATSITTVAGTLTMGSTAAITNAGLLSVGNQSNVTGVGTISSGTWQGTAIASAYLDADTAHLTTTQTFTGAKTFEEKVTLDGDKNITPSNDGVTLHVDSADITDTNTSASGTANTFFYTTIENPRLLATNSSVTTTTAATLHVKGAPVGHTNQTITNSYAIYVSGGTSYFNGDVSVLDLTVRGNDIKDDDGTTCITFDSSGNTTITGDLKVTGNDIKDSGGNTIISSDGSGVVTMAGGNIAVGGSNANFNMNSGSDIILEADNAGGGLTSSIQYNSSTGNKIMLGATSDVVVLCNRTLNGTVEIRANAAAGSGGEVTVATFADTEVTFSKPLVGDRKIAVSSGTDGNVNGGDIVYFGGTTSMTVGRIYHYRSTGAWEIANADAVATCDGLLGVALGSASDTHGVLLRGMVTLDHDPGAVGDVLYVQSDNAGTTGHATATAPSASGDCVRVVGYCVHASAGNIWFNPDSTFVEVA